MNCNNCKILQEKIELLEENRKYLNTKIDDLEDEISNIEEQLTKVDLGDLFKSIVDYLYPEFEFINAQGGDIEVGTFRNKKIYIGIKS